jgi:hypothetical protein
MGPYAVADRARCFVCSFEGIEIMPARPGKRRRRRSEKTT